MTPKEYLQQYRNADREINSKLDEIHRLRDIATKTTSTLNPDRVQTMAENKVERIVAKIVDLQKEVETEIYELIKIKRTVSDSINQIDTAAYRNVLRLRYINGWKWERIAVELIYDYHYVLRVHGQALLEIQKKILKDT
jgi:hypothetical protein